MRPTISSIQHGSAHPAPSRGPAPLVPEPAPAAVFVSQSGLRGRLLRGIGWPVSVIGAMLAAAVITSLIGMQSDAPALDIPSQHTTLPVPKPEPPSPVHSPAPGTTRPTPHP